MKLYKKLTSVFLLSALSVTASADIFKSAFDTSTYTPKSSKSATFYVGVLGGKSDIKLSQEDFPDTKAKDLKDSGALKKITLGYQLNNTFSFELGYAKVSNFDISTVRSLKGDIITASIVGNIPLNSSTTLSLKAGLMDSGIDFNLPDNDYSENIKGKIFYSGLINYKFNDISIYAGYEEYRFNSEMMKEKLKLESIVIGLNYYF
jgi:hypothetical protein